MKQTYKIRTPISYVGGKQKALQQLGSYLPADIERMASIFVGGASFELYCEWDKGINITNAYDKDEVLINFYQQIQNKETLEKLIEKVSEIAGRGFNIESYIDLRTKLKAHDKGEQIITDPFELALVFYIVHRFSFAQSSYAYGYSYKYNDERKVKADLERLGRFKSNIKFECLDFAESIEKHQGDFLYLDPPYFLDKQNLKKALYKHHIGFDHKLLAEKLKNHKGKFMLSYGDCDFVRDTYKDFIFFEPKWQYSQVVANNVQKESYEVLILNYEPKETYQKKKHIGFFGS